MNGWRKEPALTQGWRGQGRRVANHNRHGGSPATPPRRTGAGQASSIKSESVGWHISPHHKPRSVAFVPPFLAELGEKK